MKMTTGKYSQEHNDEFFFDESDFETFYSNKVIKQTLRDKRFKPNKEKEIFDYFRCRQTQKKSHKRDHKT